MIEKRIGKMNTHQNIAFNYIEEKIIKNKIEYRIIDIGAGANPWAIKYLTHIVDFFVEPNDKNKFENTKVKVFEFDIEDSLNWQVVLDDVDKFGKFDFVICSHTLEDLNNPEIVCKFINKIGKAGFISMPSKYAEFLTFENKNNIPYIGFHHHRWVYNIKNDCLIGTPKMTFHQFLTFENVDREKAFFSEIAFLWEEKFNFEFIKPDQMLDNRKGKNKILDILQPDDLPLENKVD
jgi:hypothetical protein